MALPFTLCLLLPLAAGSQATPNQATRTQATPTQTQDDAPRAGGLEQRRADVAAEAARARAAAAERIATLLSEITTSRIDPRSPEFERLWSPLTEPGHAGVPALLAALAIEPDGREDASEEARTRAAVLRVRSRAAAHALRALSSPLATERLLALATERSGTVRTLALLGLERTSEASRVVPVLTKLLSQPLESDDQAAVLGTLAVLPGEAAVAALRTALTRSEGTVCGSVLLALAQAAGRPEAEGQAGLARIKDLLEPISSFAASDRGRDGVAGLLAVLEALGDDRRREDLVESLVELCGQSRTGRLEVEAILEALTRLEIKPPRRSRGILKDLEESNDRAVREATLVWSASQKVGNARKELLRPLDDAVDENPGNSALILRRADMLYRIRDWSDALDDYQLALETSSRSSSRFLRSNSGTEPYIGIARCQARLGKDKDAARTIQDSPLTTVARRALAEDEAFAEMVNDPAYRIPVFQLRDS